MSGTVSTDLLLRVAQASPEQQVAIDQILRAGKTEPAVFVGQMRLIRSRALCVNRPGAGVLSARSRFDSLFEETFAKAKQKLGRLMSPSDLHATAVQFLEQGGEGEEAKALRLCQLEYGEIERCCGTVYEVNLTLRCERNLLEKLKRTKGESGWEEEPQLKLRLLEALRASLPSGYDVGNVEARARVAVSRAVGGRPAGVEREALNFGSFSEAEWLAKLGRPAVVELLEPFAAHLAQAGLPLPQGQVGDQEYFAEVSRILRAEGFPGEVRAGVEQMLENARLIIAEVRREGEADFAKRHYLFPLFRRDSGRALLSTVAGRRS